jgi:hypothetical protein
LDKAIARISEATVDSEIFKIKVFSCKYDLLTASCIRHGDFLKGLRLLPEVSEGLVDFQEKTDNFLHANIGFNMAYILFANGLYDQSLSWLLRLIHSDKLKDQHDHQVTARILGLITHFELGNMSILGYLNKLTLNHISKKDKHYDLELWLLNSMNRFDKLKSKKDEAAFFATIKASLEAKIKNPKVNRSMVQFDYLSWLESKSGENSFTNIIKTDMGK